MVSIVTSLWHVQNKPCPQKQDIGVLLDILFATSKAVQCYSKFDVWLIFLPAQQGVGERIQSINLTIISPGLPLIFIPPVNLFEINNGSSAVFQCEASAVPEHNVFWTFTNPSGNTRVIISTTEPDTNKYQVKRTRGTGAGFGELTILDVQYEDRGRYTCTAMNSVGSNISNANLTVHGEPFSVVL